ncbi:cobalamin-dependent protein, partial [bacterium]|nr:cobalamin-dependent protein [bacterium]
MKIALLSPRGPLYRHKTGIFKRSLRYMPLTLPTLAALIPPEIPHQLSLFDEGIGDIPMELDADLIGISAITGSSARAYELADHFRRQGKCVVLGGVHPTLLPDEAALHADSVVVGYAEESWPQLLRDFRQGNLQSRYRQQPGLQLGGRPLPRRDLLPDGNFTVGHTLEATRGCIHKCNFCVVPSAWGRPLQHPVTEVIADVKQMGARRLIFMDLNLIADKE